jgi:transposase
MPAPIRIKLNQEEECTLKELRKVSTVPYRVRDRANLICLNAQGWKTADLATMFDCCEHTVRATLKRWQVNGLGGLWEASGRGRKPKWQPADIAYLEHCLKTEERTYNSAQLALKLKEERHVELSSDRIRRLLKKKMGVETHSP